MSEDIEQSWARVTGWLAAHADASYATLRPPAAPTEIESCERELGMALPADLKKLQLVNNGAADFDADGTYCQGAAFMPGDHRMLSSAEIAQQSQSLNEIAASYGGDMIGYWWHPRWVLFARHIAADGLAIDQRQNTGRAVSANSCTRTTPASTWHPRLARSSPRWQIPSTTVLTSCTTGLPSRTAAWTGTWSCRDKR
jgi:cell wall assembly regulator SMI1